MEPAERERFKAAARAGNDARCDTSGFTLQVSEENEVLDDERRI